MFHRFHFCMQRFTCVGCQVTRYDDPIWQVTPRSSEISHEALYTALTFEDLYKYLCSSAHHHHNRHHAATIEPLLERSCFHDLAPENRILCTEPLTSCSTVRSHVRRRRLRDRLQFSAGGGGSLMLVRARVWSSSAGRPIQKSTGSSVGEAVNVWFSFLRILWTNCLEQAT